MDAFLLGTTILSIYLDPTHQLHAEKSRALDDLPAAAPRYISAVALAELTFEADLAAATGKGDESALREMIRKACAYTVLDITNQTVTTFAKLKSRIAAKYLAKPHRHDRPKYVENWVNQATGDVLGVGENYLWMWAQAKERGLVLVTTDRRIKRIVDADADVRLLII